VEVNESVNRVLRNSATLRRELSVDCSQLIV
jgi:hypothetical protein